jgi:uncharacterized protein YbbC (DUF1343 family)
MNQHFSLGIDRLLVSPVESFAEDFKNKRIALLSHPAGVDSNAVPTVDSLTRYISHIPGAKLTALFGPQHGLRGEKQDNMVESYDYQDPETGLPAYSLYGTTRRLTEEMLSTFDVLLVDLQDVGVRVYTFLTTVGYLVEDLSQHSGKTLIILDRPNPTGRLIEGNLLEPGWESFVGIDAIPMQHGFTLGEFALWYKEKHQLATTLKVIPMEGWDPTNPVNAWPKTLLWLQPSPNMPSLVTARCYPGTVMLEGTTLSEARGTTRPLSQIGYPQLDWKKIMRWLSEYTHGQLDPYSIGALIRYVAFQPTFHKHNGEITLGLELIPEAQYYDPKKFKPFRLIAGLLKAIHVLYPTLNLWTKPPYEYEYEKIPIDVITGGQKFRSWVEDSKSTWVEFSDWLENDEHMWREESSKWYLYPNSQEFTQGGN